MVVLPLTCIGKAAGAMLQLGCLPNLNSLLPVSLQFGC